MHPQYKAQPWVRARNLTGRASVRLPTGCPSPLLCTGFAPPDASLLPRSQSPTRSSRARPPQSSRLGEGLRRRCQTGGRSRSLPQARPDPPWGSESQPLTSRSLAGSSRGAVQMALADGAAGRVGCRRTQRLRSSPQGAPIRHIESGAVEEMETVATGLGDRIGGLMTRGTHRDRAVDGSGEAGQRLQSLVPAGLAVFSFLCGD